MYMFGTKASYDHEQCSFDSKKNEETERQKEDEEQGEGENLSRNMRLTRIQTNGS